MNFNLSSRGGNHDEIAVGKFLTQHEASEKERGMGSATG